MKKLNRRHAGPWTTVATVVGAVAATQAAAIGFGPVSPVAVLGQNLDVTVPVRVEGGEHFESDCAHAEVSFGDARLVANQVHLQVTHTGDAWRARVTTDVPVSEPVVEIDLAAGCDRPFTRRFTAFADPPLRVARGGPINPPTVAPVATAQGVPPTGAGPATELAASSDGSLHSVPAGTSRARAGGAGKGPTRAAAAALEHKDKTRRATADATSSRKESRGAHAPATQAGEQPRLVLDSGYAHLRLDMEEPMVPAASVASAASGGAFGFSELEDADLKRVQALEQNLLALKKESQASRAQTAALQARLAAAESRADWLPWLFAALGVAVAAAGVLGWRLRRQQDGASGHWLPEAAAEAPRVAPVQAPAAIPGVRVVPTMTQRASVPDDGGPSVAGQLINEPDGGPESNFPEDLSATQPLSRAAMAAAMQAEAGAASAPRELSVEELLDLEQQADFFIALGQEDAAVDLLMSHLRSAGGQSPLPYTKLLEIYRRQGDRAAYERTRARFNRRFNAYAPDWDVGPGAGRTLEDYPETIAHIQSVWHSPLDAMAILEALLFKRDDTSELFDLPAYRDVLVLYALARDLWQQSGEANGTLVDVLLPLDDLPPEPARTFGAGGPATQFGGGDLSVEDVPPFSATPAPDPGLPRVDEGMLPSRAPAPDAPGYELTGFEVLQDHHEASGGGVQATLDASHLPPSRGGASNDEAAPESAPGKPLKR